MTPERWALVKSILADALDQPLSERHAFVDAITPGDDELRREVLSLLASAEADESLPGARAAVLHAADSALGAAALDATSMADTVQRALGVQYRIVRELGHGGMGMVYLAQELALDRFVAVKVLRPDRADLHGARERFRREARIAARLSHPGIVPLHTFGEVDGLWYFVMSYVRGMSLAERLRIDGRIAEAEGARIIAELAAALAHAHAEGVVHRDIKPANVLLDSASGRAVLADFGIAKLVDGEGFTSTGLIVGTPSFMAPEQATGFAPVDERSDIYALGAVARAMMGDGMSPRLRAVIEQALRDVPGERWPSAEALHAALMRLEGMSADALPPRARELPTFGAYALLWGALWLVVAAMKGRHFYDRLLLVLVAAIVPCGALLHVWNASDRTVPPGELLQVAFWPPEWWSMWWPASLRRPGDLWRRLPRPAWAARVALSLFLVTLPALILLREWFDAVSTAREFLQVELTVLLGAAAVIGGALVWALRRGLHVHDASRLLFGATLPSRTWTTPALARLLRPLGASEEPEPESAMQHLHAIVRRVPGADVARRAEGQAERIATLDSEIAQLTQLATDAEVDRLQARLDGMQGPATTTAHDELHGLLQRELEVVQEMRSRREVLMAERRVAMGELRSLWLSVRGVDARVAPGGIPERVDEGIA